jgi:peptide/nickel transport system substrate-binding protein
VSGAASQLQLVELGEADIAVVIDPDRFDEIASNPGLQILEGPSLALDFLAMHTSEEVGGPLAKKEARQAIAHAIDYAGIIDGLSGGRAVRPAAPVPLGLLGADEVEALRYETDIARANELWAASGNGPSEITFTYDASGISATGVSVDLLAAKFQEDVQKIEGVTVVLNPMDAAQRLQEFRDSKLQFTYSGWAPDFADVHSYADPFGREGGIAAKRVGFVNDETGPLLDQGIVETDPEKRRDIYVQVQEILVEEVPFLSIVQPTYVMPATASLVGAQPHGTYLLQLRYASKQG